MSYLNDLKKHEIDRETLAAALRKAFHKRKLPFKWQVGQKVRFITDHDWGWSKGDTAYVIALRPEYGDKKASEYQVFYTGHKDGKGGQWWTTPEDVELIEDVL